MKRYLTAAAVAATLLAGHLSADAQQIVYPQGGYAQPPTGYAPQTGMMMPPGYMAASQGVVGQEGVNLAALQPADPANLTGACQIGCAEGCIPGCDTCYSDPCTCIKNELYADFLYLRPRSAEVAFAVDTNAVVNPLLGPPIQVGPVTMVDPDFEPGFRLGFRRFIDPCASIGAEYWHYESSTAAFASSNAPTVLQGLLLHPLSTISANTGWGQTAAVWDIDFDRVNADYRYIWSSSERHELALVGGAAYANLDQHLVAAYAQLGQTRVTSDVDFDGGGIRLGLEGERHSACTGFFVYGKGYASFLAGDFQARYLQTSSFDPVVVNTGWEAGRLVPILDLELGIGWQSYNGGLRLSAGYMVSGWYNVVTTDEWIKAVQSNNFVGLSDEMTFDGLAVRGEFRF